MLYYIPYSILSTECYVDHRVGRASTTYSDQKYLTDCKSIENKGICSMYMIIIYVTFSDMNDQIMPYSSKLVIIYLHTETYVHINLRR